MHSTDHYIDQSPEALRLSLVEGQIDMEAFHVYSTRTLQCGSLTITARIIGASHVISYGVDRHELHEALACVDLRPGSDSCWTSISRYRWEGLFQPIERRTARYSYRFGARSIPWSDPEPVEIDHLLNPLGPPRSGDGFGLVQHFPRGEHPATPKTIIVGHYDNERGVAVIETAHSYPNVRGLVMSRTELQLTGGVQ